MIKSKEELELECKKLQKLDRWYGILVVSGMAIIVIGLLVLDSLTVTFIGMIPAMIAVIFLTPRFHCPYCGAYLRMKFGLPSKCPRCGERLSGPDKEEQQK